MKIISKPSYTDMCCVSANASTQFLNIRIDENFRILPCYCILLTKPDASWAILNFSNSRGMIVVESVEESCHVPGIRHMMRFQKRMISEMISTKII